MLKNFIKEKDFFEKTVFYLVLFILPVIISLFLSGYIPILLPVLVIELFILIVIISVININKFTIKKIKNRIYNSNIDLNKDVKIFFGPTFKNLGPYIIIGRKIKKINIKNKFLYLPLCFSEICNKPKLIEKISYHELLKIKIPK